MGDHSNRVLLHECLYWDCAACGARNIEHWTAKELSSKHIERLRKKGKSIGQSYWYVAAPSSVICASCGNGFECVAFISE